ncbi:MAG: hypothetical protein JW791_01245 [Nanoarchaeota archaeon]|nr:hypothetical protein [Nanoarchaeota archaeon]
MSCLSSKVKRDEVVIPIDNPLRHLKDNLDRLFTDDDLMSVNSYLNNQCYVLLITERTRDYEVSYVTYTSEGYFKLEYEGSCKDFIIGEIKQVMPGARIIEV